MQTINEMLDDARARHQLSDYALAARMGISRQQISKYRNEGYPLSERVALELAPLIGRSPEYVLACVAAEKAKTDAARTAWRKLAGAAAAVFLAVQLALWAPLEIGEQYQTVSATTDAPIIYIIRSAVIAILLILCIKIYRPKNEQ